jgi:hypothetical protein
MSTKHVVNQKLEHVEDISSREVFGRISVFFFTKIRSASSNVINKETVFASEIALNDLRDKKTYE